MTRKNGSKTMQELTAMLSENEDLLRPIAQIVR
jgi:hypothetical protein